MKNLIKFALAMSIFTVACVDSNPTPEPVKPELHEYVVYTHASCNGDSRNSAVKICVESDQAAQEYADAWFGACEALQGLIDTADQGHSCPANWWCAQSVQPTYQICK